MKRSLLLLAVMLLGACESLRYYGQAIGGQFSILQQRRDIEALIADETTDPGLRRQLESILSIREFAASELQLPLDESFSTYADIGRPYVVWNVFAAPEFSVKAREWCFPIAGCVTYRGYFSEQAARDYADKLARAGFEVYVGGVAAYSTLGWFSDPVLNTVIQRAEHRLAALVFHELAHQQVYIAGDTAFNESFATAVELEGLSRWLTRTRGDAQAQRTLEAVALEMRCGEDFAALVSGAVDALEALYAEDLPPAAMRAGKQAVIAGLRADYAGLRQSRHGCDAYDAWFERDLNNAQLLTVSTYFDKVPAFRELLADEGGDLVAFYARVREISRLPRDERERLLGGNAGTPL